MFLFADLIDVIQVLIPLGLFLFWLFSQIVGQKGKNPGRPAQQGGGADEDRGLRSQIEEFLRQAKENQQRQNQPRDQQQPRNQQQQPFAQQNDEQQRERERNKQRQAQRKRELARQRAKTIASGSRADAIDAEVIEDVVTPAQSLSDHVSSYMSTDDVRASASHLGEEIGLSDERLEAHLLETFGQPLERSGGKVLPIDESRRVTVVSGEQIAAMLQNPVNIRKAILLHEILTPPSDRWK